MILHTLGPKALSKCGNKNRALFFPYSLKASNVHFVGQHERKKISSDFSSRKSSKIPQKWQLTHTKALIKMREFQTRKKRFFSWNMQNWSIFLWANFQGGKLYSMRCLLKEATKVSIWRGPKITKEVNWERIFRAASLFFLPPPWKWPNTQWNMPEKQWRRTLLLFCPERRNFQPWFRLLKWGKNLCQFMENLVF